MIFIALLSAVPVAEAGATDAWMRCIVDRSVELSRSPDPAETVARAAMTLCSSSELAARAERTEMTYADLEARGVITKRSDIREETLNEGWARYLTMIRDNTTAIVVKTRATR